MKVDELIGLLLTFKMTIDDKFEKKSKGVVFKVETKDCDDQIKYDVDENLIVSISMPAKSVVKVMIRPDKRFRNNDSTNVKDNNVYSLKSVKFQRKGKDGEKLNKGKSI